MGVLSVFLDTFELGEDTNFKITKISGLSKSDIRTSQMNFSGKSGGEVLRQFYAMRQITITGLIKGTTPSAHQQDRIGFGTATPIGTQIPVYFRMFDGSYFVAYCNVLDLKMDHLTYGTNSEYKLELLAGDPLLYDANAGPQSINIAHSKPGGYITPAILPVVWADGETPTIVNNNGTVEVYPTITLKDAANNPVVKNLTTGQQVKLNMTMINGDVVVIDMKNRTIKLNGVSVLANRDNTSSSWWSLIPGDNSLLLDSDSTLDPITATVGWLNGVEGI